MGKNLHLDGLLSARGLDGQGGGAGGGSGGSVLVETLNVTGHGEINVNGGTGKGTGGGGSGGRVGIHVDFKNTFGGIYQNQVLKLFS